MGLECQERRYTLIYSVLILGWAFKEELTWVLSSNESFFEDRKTV